MTDTVLRADHLTVGYQHRRRQVPILRGVHLELRRGELACLLGPNGAGKSTLLRTLVGTQPPLHGTVHLGGIDIATISARARAQLLSVVLTDRIDVGYLSARSLVELGRQPHVGWFSRLDRDDRAVVEWAIDAAGAGDVAHRLVHELSDGERQRVMIARALAQEPKFLVLDEPTAYLDLARRVELMVLLRRLADEVGLAVLMSTHELELALRNADAAWLVDQHGSVSQGAPEDLAISGALEQAFASDEVSFDHDLGGFVAGGPPSEPRGVLVPSEVPDRSWLTRMIERVGLRACERPARHALGEISRSPDGAAWRYVDATGAGSEHADLRSLARALRSAAHLSPSPALDISPTTEDPYEETHL